MIRKREKVGTSIYLDVELLNILDQVASELELSRSQYFELAIKITFHNEEIVKKILERTKKTFIGMEYEFHRLNKQERAKLIQDLIDVYRIRREDVPEE